MQDNQTLESPPEVQFAGVSRWLKENLFSSLSSSILTLISVAAVVSVFRSIIGFLYLQRESGLQLHTTCNCIWCRHIQNQIL